MACFPAQSEDENMNFYLDDTPSSSQSTPSFHEYSAQKGENDLAAETPGLLSRPDTEEQTTSYGGPACPVTVAIVDRSVIDEISSKVQDLVEKINNSRASDQRVMDSFQEELMTKVTEVCQEMKESMYTVYEDNSNEMHVKLKELSRVLESCTRLHQELMEATQALTGLRVSIGVKKQDC